MSDRPTLDYAPAPPRRPHPIEKALKILLSVIAIALGLLFIVAVLTGFR